MTVKPIWIETPSVEVIIGALRHRRYGGELPPERHMVLVQIDGGIGEAPAVGVGYLKFAAGDRDCPYFVVPGARENFVVTHWADCLGDDFTAPLWKMTQSTR